MTETDYSYLRVWRDEPESVASPLQRSLLVERLRAAFEQVTGWVLDRTETIGQLRHRNEQGLTDLDSLAPLEIIDMSAALPARQSALHRQKCDQLAAAISAVFRELALARREARLAHNQLAAELPVAMRAEQVARWGESILRCLFQAARDHRFTSAAVFLLDGSAEHLHRRFACGDALTASSLAQRPLLESPADVEAMSGHAVVLTRVAEIRQWRVPCPCRTAVCLPLSTLSNVLGSIWFVSDRRRRISNQLMRELELFSTRLASEIECQNVFRRWREAEEKHEVRSASPHG